MAQGIVGAEAQGTADDAPPVRERLLRRDPPALLGARCPVCEQLSFPHEPYCAHCGAPDPELVALPDEGTVYSYAIVRFAAPGYLGPVPYAVGIVELDGQIRVASTLSAAPLSLLAVGSPVRLVLTEVPGSDGPVTGYAHELVAASR